MVKKRLFFELCLLLIGISACDHNTETVTEISQSREIHSEMNETKGVVSSENLWKKVTFEEAVDRASVIVYGEIVSKSDIKTRDFKNGEEERYADQIAEGYYPSFYAYREVVIQISDVIKGSKTEREFVIYREFGGVYQDVEYVYPDIPTTEIGDKVIFFLNPWEGVMDNVLITPSFLFTVRDGKLVVNEEALPEKYRTNGSAMMEMTPDEFMSEVRKYLGKD